MQKEGERERKWRERGEEKQCRDSRRKLVMTDDKRCGAPKVHKGNMTRQGQTEEMGNKSMRRKGTK